MDESQNTYDDNFFWDHFKEFCERTLDSTLVRVIVFAQYNTKIISKKPFDFPCSLGLTVLKAKESELKELYQDFNNLQKQYKQPILPEDDDYLRVSISKITDNHFGLITATCSLATTKYWKLN